MIQRKSMKEILFESLEELMQKTQLDKISVKDIASNANTSCKTFYNNFADKHALATWHYIENNKKFISKIGKNYSWQDSALECMQMIYIKKTFYQNLVTYEGQNSFIKTILNSDIQDFIYYIMKIENTDTIEPDILYATEFYYNGCAKMGEKWIREGMKISPEEYIKLLNNCIPPILKPYRLCLKT